MVAAATGITAKRRRKEHHEMSSLKMMKLGGTEILQVGFSQILIEITAQIHIRKFEEQTA